MYSIILRFQCDMYVIFIYIYMYVNSVGTHVRYCARGNRTESFDNRLTFPRAAFAPFDNRVRRAHARGEFEPVKSRPYCLETCGETVSAAVGWVARNDNEILLTVFAPTRSAWTTPAEPGLRDPVDFPGRHDRSSVSDDISSGTSGHRILSRKSSGVEKYIIFSKSQWFVSLRDADARASIQNRFVRSRQTKQKDTKRDRSSSVTDGCIKRACK